MLAMTARFIWRMSDNLDVFHEGGITMDVREKLVELLRADCCPDDGCDFCEYADFEACRPHFLADHLISNGVTVSEWISVDERLPENFISVLGYMTDAEEFPPVRECYTVGNAFFFPALGDVHQVSHWCEMPQHPAE